MKMEKGQNEVVVAKASVKVMGNGRVRLNRVIKNLFLGLFGKDRKLAGIDELQVEGCFSNIQKEKKKIESIIKAQADAIVQRENKVKQDTKKSDKAVAKLNKEIAEKQKELQENIADIADQNAEIKKEMDRSDRVCKRMDEFFE